MWSLSFFEFVEFYQMDRPMICAENLTLSNGKRHGDCDLAAQEAIRIASLYGEVKKELRLRKIVGVQNETLYGQEGGIGSKRAGLSDQDIQ
mgnify:CR=1 FL=1